MSVRGARILAAVAGQAWAIEPDRGRILFAGVARAVRDGHPEADFKAADEAPPYIVHPTGDIELLEARINKRQERRVRESPGAVAVIPVHGAMLQRVSPMAEVSGLVSTERLGRQVTAAAQAPDVKALILHMDSPGGGVHGVSELADRVFAAREEVTVVALADSLAASAAYWVASQAHEVVVAPGGDVGSVGVFLAHEEISGMLESMGIVETLIFAEDSPFKVDGNPFEPLSETARAFYQERVDAAMSDFVATVARGRGVEADQVIERFGQGRLVRAREAVRAGMADRIDTLSGTLARFLPDPDNPRARARARAAAVTKTLKLKSSPGEQR